MKHRLPALVAVFCIIRSPLIAEPMKLATFDVDATPPLGSDMAYDPVRRLDELTLRCRGVVLIGADKPVVLCAVDWIGIANEGHDFFRAELAKAAETDATHVAVHTLHQHDAPGCDFTAEKIVQELKLEGYGRYNSGYQRAVVQHAAEAIRAALPKAETITHWGWGEAVVKEVASQRRIKGLNGLIRATRTSSTKDPAIRAEPEGLIDPHLTMLTFWNVDAPVAVITSYACHPQSYYRTGVPSPDFPGIARFMRGQDVPVALHVHFNGAGGNITAGKYNDGARENRLILAQRLADGMKQAFAATTRKTLDSADVKWSRVSVSLPLATHLNEPDLIDKLKTTPAKGYVAYADQLAWVRRCQQGHRLDVTGLSIGEARMLHLPGELFVEYQLAAKALRPDLHVMMAAYGDYGPGYIGTAAAYQEGGYETGPTSSNVAPGSEAVLSDAVRQLLSK